MFKKMSIAPETYFVSFIQTTPTAVVSHIIADRVETIEEALAIVKEHVIDELSGFDPIMGDAAWVGDGDIIELSWGANIIYHIIPYK